MNVLKQFYNEVVIHFTDDVVQGQKKQWEQMILNRFSEARQTGAIKYMVDNGRAHDNWILHYVQKLGFTKIATEMTTYQHNMTLDATAEALATLPAAEAKELYMQFFTGENKLDALMDNIREGGGICFPCPESKSLTGMLVRVLQENMLMCMHCNKEYKIGLLFNIHRLPLDEEGNPQVYLGLQLLQNMFMDIHMWPFIDYLSVYKQPKKGQFQTAGQKDISRMSYYGVLVMTSNNPNVAKLLMQMKDGKCLADDHPSKQFWGHHKTDLAYLRAAFRDGKDLRMNTFDFIHVPFPKCLCHELEGDSDKVVDLKRPDDYVYEIRLSMDIPGSAGLENEVTKLIDTFELPEKLQDIDVHFNKLWRRSYAHWSNDPITAWDITVLGAKTNYQINLTINQPESAIS